MLLNKSLFDLPPSEIQRFGLANLTYGSLTTKGLHTLKHTLEPLLKTTIYGLDLGCGDGELIYHLQRTLPESIWEGVEISGHRVAQCKRDVHIWEGDMLEENLRPYNVLHADNLCLDDSIAEELEKKIALEFTGIYITYRQPQSPCFFKKAAYIKTVQTQTTWTNHPIHYYRL